MVFKSVINSSSSFSSRSVLLSSSLSSFLSSSLLLVTRMPPSSRGAALSLSHPRARYTSLLALSNLAPSVDRKFARSSSAWFLISAIVLACLGKFEFNSWFSNRMVISFIARSATATRFSCVFLTSSASFANAANALRMLSSKSIRICFLHFNAAS